MPLRPELKALPEISMLTTPSRDRLMLAIEAENAQKTYKQSAMADQRLITPTNSGAPPPPRGSPQPDVAPAPGRVLAGARPGSPGSPPGARSVDRRYWPPSPPDADRKSTRLNSSHVKISYAVFCLKKKTA